MFGNSTLSPEMLMALGGGIMSGSNLGTGMGQGFQNASTVMAAQKQKAEVKTAENKTREWLKQQFPGEDFDTMTPDMMKSYVNQAVQQRFAKPKFMTVDGKIVKLDENTGENSVVGDYSDPKKPNLIETKNGIYDADSKQWITPPPGVIQDAVKRGLTPVWGMKNGKRVLGTVGEDGSFKEITLPEGFEPTPGTSTVDLGTTVEVRDNKSGDTLRVIPKDIAGVEQQKVEGKTLGENKTQLPTALAKADQTIKDIDEALTHPGLESATGWQSVFPTVAGSQSADFEAKLDKLKGGAFLEAFKSLQGGGQITEVEGKKATDAIAVLSTSQSDAALRQALYDLREVIATGRERAMKNAGVNPTGDVVKLGPDGEGYDQLAPGTRYVSPDGKTRVKGGK